MKYRLLGSIFLLVIMMVTLLAGCRSQFVRPEQRTYEDGTYRGVYIEKDAVQVQIQFTLKEGTMTAASFRHLWQDEHYRLKTDKEPYRSVIQQYQEALDHLVGKKLAEHLADLYRPGDIVTTRVDGYSGATIRANKMISAIRDGLNRGVYSYN